MGQPDNARLSERNSDDGQVLARWLFGRPGIDPAAVAVEYGDGRLTYGDLFRRAMRLAHHLSHLGLAPGSRIATVCDNDPDQLVLLIACSVSGLILVPLNRRLAPCELAAQLELTAPALVASSPAYRHHAMEAVRAHGHPVPVVELAELVDEADRPISGQGRAPHQVASGDDPLLIIFTSGTTGRPKGAVLTHANCCWTNRSLERRVPLSPEDVVLQVLPQCHVGGWNTQPLQALAAGATLVLEPRFEPDRVLELIARRGVTTMMGVPTTYLMLAESSGFDTTDLTSLRSVLVGGAAMPPDLLHLWRRRGAPVYQGYGLTEAAPNVLCLDPDQAMARPRSVGQPYAFVDVALHEPETGRRVDCQGAGELWVSGPNVFAGYWRDPAATAETMAGRWLRTGDLAERDAHGFYRIYGRRKELYVSGGENVYPAEVELVLREHRDVADAAVVGVPDRRWGEQGVAFVQSRCGCTASEQRLLEHCRGRLAGFKVPRQVVVVDELPRLETGKPDKHRLAELALDADGRAGMGLDPDRALVPSG